MVAASALIPSTRPAMAGPFTADDFASLVPPDKKLSKQWMESLFARGEPMQATGEDLRYIGMPISGICTGQVYLGGDGKLWYWNLDNARDPSANSRGTRYLEPSLESSPFEQGFAIKVTKDGREQVLTLDADGFDDITFTNRYPMAEVAYRTAGSPVSVDLEALTPFIPLDRDESSYPVTILRYTLTNLTDQPQQVGIAGWIENISNRHTGSSKLGQRVNRFTAGADVSVIECSVEPPFPIADGEEEIEVFADFEGQDYGDWTVEGDAFGQAPAKGARTVQKLSGFEGQGLVNSWTGSDVPQGKLTSPEFVIRRPFINFLLGGGRYRNATAIELLVDGQPARVATGENSDLMRWVTWHVADLQGKTGQIVIKDSASGGWGHIDVDQIEFSTVPRQSDLLLHKETDFGALAIAILGDEAPELADLDLRLGAEWAFGERPGNLTGGQEARRKLDEQMFASLGRQVMLAPEEQKSVVFALGWRFPNATPTNGNFYATRWPTATGVLQAVAGKRDNLRDATKRWVETWNDSTLPHWFLERTFVTVDCVQTLTAQRFTRPPGRYHFNEGVQCCGGNCTHVWHYAQGLARVFPEIERECRRQVEFGIGFEAPSGRISYRAVASGFSQAIDGQCGTILRVLREHQMTSDGNFLEAMWPLTKKAMEYTIRTWDPDEDGLSGGKQHNTLDADWYGEVPWLVNLYHAALKASAEMARQMNDELFASKCERILESGIARMIANCGMRITAIS
jgi:non-lysosomal glucosylceramidase